MTIVDTHCHAGRNWFEPVELLLHQMNANGVDKAVLIQHRGTFDNAYLFECARRFPGRFAVVVIVDTTRTDAPEALEHWADQGAVGVRLSPTERSSGGDPLAIWRKAAQLGLVVSSLGQVEGFASDEFAGLVAELPELPIVVEHLAGVGQGAEPPYATYKKALALAGYPNTYIKVGGLGEISMRPPVLKPELAFDHTPPLVEMAYDAFGPRRMMWGSDYPPVSGREGYRNALHGVMEHPALTAKQDREWVMGRTALTVFRFDEPVAPNPSPDWVWSTWSLLEPSAVDQVPPEQGVFETRVQGTEAVVFVGTGVGGDGLKESLSRRASQPERHLSGYEKEMVGQGRQLEFRFAVAVTSHQAEQWHTQRLHEYMEAHGGLAPPGNEGATP